MTGPAGIGRSPAGRFRWGSECLIETVPIHIAVRFLHGVEQSLYSRILLLFHYRLRTILHPPRILRALYILRVVHMYLEVLRTSSKPLPTEYGVSTPRPPANHRPPCPPLRSSHSPAPYGRVQLVILPYRNRHTQQANKSTPLGNLENPSYRLPRVLLCSTYSLPTPRKHNPDPDPSPLFDYY